MSEIACCLLKYYQFRLIHKVSDSQLDYASLGFSEDDRLIKFKDHYVSISNFNGIPIH